MKKGRIHINAPIGQDGLTAAYISSWIDWHRAEFDVDSFIVYINSPGGDYFEGVGIYNLLLDVNCEIRISGRAASAAAFIAMAADPGKLFIAENSFIVVHNAWIKESGSGDYKFYEGIAKGLEKIGRSQIEAFAKRTGKAESDIESLLNNESTMTAKEAVEAGFADEFVSNEKISREEMDYHRDVLGYVPNVSQSEEGKTMNKETLALLGLNENATEEQILAALKAKNTTIEDLEKQVKDDTEETPTPSVAEEVLSRLDTIEANQKKTEKDAVQTKVESLVNAAINDGKILPADKDIYLGAANADFDKTKTRLDAIAKNSAVPSKVQTPGDGTTKVSSHSTLTEHLRTQVK